MSLVDLYLVLVDLNFGLDLDLSYLNLGPDLRLVELDLMLTWNLLVLTWDLT